ncbi:hypothetical protein DYB28_008160, partial [Aphanomyces astaci]
APGITDSDTATYVAAHHVLLAHATAVQTHRSKHLTSKIGITLNSDMALPLDPTDDRDVEAAERKLQFSLGWFLNPIVHGDYPAVMKRRAGHRLPRFTAADSALLTQSYDVFMLNHYSTNVVTDCASTTYGQVASTKCFPLDEQAQGPTPSTDPLTSSTTSHWVQGAVTVGFVGPMLVAVMALAALVYRKQQQHRSSEQAGENSPLVPKH